MIRYEIWQGGRKVAGMIEDRARAQRYAEEYTVRYHDEGPAEVREVEGKAGRGRKR